MSVCFSEGRNKEGFFFEKEGKFFFVHPCTSAKACTSENVYWSAMRGSMGPFFPETDNKGGRFENTVDSSGATIQCESLSCGPLDV